MWLSLAKLGLGLTGRTCQSEQDCAQGAHSKIGSQNGDLDFTDFTAKVLMHRQFHTY